MKKRLIIFTLSTLMIILSSLSVAAYTISGYISSGTSVTLSGDALQVKLCDSTGFYEFTGLTEGDYKITPSKPYKPPRVKLVNPRLCDSVTDTLTITAEVQTDYCGYAYEPPHINYISLNSDQTNQNFQDIVTSCCLQVLTVDFFIDDILVHTETTGGMCEARFTYSWDTSADTDGPHIVKIVASDETMGTGSAEYPVIVNNNLILGDADVDGKINIVDTLLIAQSYVYIYPGNIFRPTSDVNLDNLVNIIDALLIAQYYVGVISSLPPSLDGGFTQISENSREVLSAYDFLKKDLALNYPNIILGKVKLAFSQVVAGSNIRLVCYYFDTNTSRNHFLSADIYLNFDMVPISIRSFTPIAY